MMKLAFAILLFAFALATLALAYLVRPHPVNEASGAARCETQLYILHMRLLPSGGK
jgi:hypothetical protein